MRKRTWISLAAALACSFNMMASMCSAEPNNAWRDALRAGQEASDKGDYAAAKTKLEESLTAANSPKQKIETLLELAAMYRRQDKIDAAVKSAQEALDTAKKEMSDDHALVSKALKETADLLFLCGKGSASQKYYDEIQEFKNKYPEEFAKREEEKEGDPATFLDRAFGKTPKYIRKNCYFANPKATQNVPTLGALFLTKAVPLQKLDAAFHSYDPSLAKSVVEVGKTPQGIPVGLIGWGSHVVRVVVIERAMPAPILKSLANASRLGPADRNRALANKAHAAIYYVGYDPRLAEQWAAVAAVAGALESCGATAVLSEVTERIVPARAMSAATIKKHSLAALRKGEVARLYQQEE